MNRRDRKDKGNSLPWNDSPLKRASFFEPGDSSPGGLTGIILAGGKSRRMGGRNKAFLELDGRSLIEIVIERVQNVCAEVLIVAGDTSPYAGLGVPLVEDHFRGVGVLGGLHAGLEAALHELALVVGCDMPFLSPELLQAFAAWAEGYDVAVLRHPPPTLRGFAASGPPPRKAGGTEGGLYVEPLHAAYRRTCLPAIEAAIKAGKRRIVSFFTHVHVRYVIPAEIASIDPGLRSFRNINTPDEWDAVQAEWATSTTHQG
jgi:molybdopterin-guanine dinucleotide biosynthesis protein A